MSTEIRQNLPIKTEFECPHCDTKYWLFAEKIEGDWMALGVKEIENSYIPYPKKGMGFIETQSGKPRITKPKGVKE